MSDLNIWITGQIKMAEFEAQMTRWEIFGKKKIGGHIRED